MKKLLSAIITMIILVASFSIQSWKQQSEPWSKAQLMEPSDLAKMINSGKADQIKIFSVGPSPVIKHSINIGSTRNAANLEKLKAHLEKLPKDENLVVYCGCCPFKNCPNVRPAFSLLNKMRFTNHKLLNLPKNIKSDWIDKGYPMMD